MSNGHLEQYRRDGYAVVRGVFGAAEVAEMAAAFERIYAEGLGHPKSYRDGNVYFRVRTDPNIGRVIRLVQWPSYFDPVLAKYRIDPRMFDIVSPLIGRDVKQIINQLHWKPPGAAHVEFGFHQDVRFRRPRTAYRDLATSYVQTGIAIDRHTIANGAMRVARGSQRLGEVTVGEHARSVMDRELDGAELEPLGVAASDVVDLEMAPGDVALWNLFTVHGSGPNDSAADRRFYLNGYVAADKCDRGEWAWRDGKPVPLGRPQLVHYEQLHERPEPHYVDEG
jgi:ectoine hydroxylase-related dioxygenase (phytanoyl-CoA dioxygenase family)